MCRDKVIEALNHFNIKLEILKKLIERTNNEETKFSNIIVCSLLIQDRILLEEFIKILEEILED